VYHRRSRVFLEINISRRPFRQKMSRCSHTNTRCRWSFTVIYACKHTLNIGPTWCKSQNGWQPMWPAAMRNRIHLVLNEQVGCYACHFDSKLTIYSSGFPTALRYLLPQDFPLRFVIIISSHLHQQIMAPQTPQQCEGGTESSRTMGAYSNTPPAETQLECRHDLVHCDAANAATGNITLHPQLKIVC